MILKKQIKKNLLFDITLLVFATPEDGCRGGLYFVAYNLLLSFLASNEFNLVLYVDHRRFFKLKSFIKNNLSGYNNFSVYEYKPYSLWSKLFSFCFSLTYYYKKTEKDSLFRKILRFVAYKYIAVYEKFFYRPDFSKYDAFFSPFDPLSPEILNSNNLKKYVFLHDTLPVVLKDFYRPEQTYTYWYDCIEPSLSEKVTYFVNSISTKNDFLKFYPFLREEQFNVVYLGASERFSPCSAIDKISRVKAKFSIPVSTKYFMLLSSFDPKKNFFFAVNNFIEFVKRYKIEDVDIIICGGIRDMFKTEFFDFLNTLPEIYKSKVIYTGYVDDEDVPVLMSGACAFLMPSLYEGFGMPILEAMKCGCPVICSNTSAMPEVIGDCGIQIDPRSDEDMFNAYKKMYFDNEFRLECSKKGLKRAEFFTWERCSGLIMNKICSDFEVDKS